MSARRSIIVVAAIGAALVCWGLVSIGSPVRGATTDAAVSSEQPSADTNTSRTRGISPPEPAAAAGGGVQPLCVALAGVDAAPNPLAAPTGEPKTGQDLMAQVIEANRAWFQWVPAKGSYDVLVTIETTVDKATNDSSVTMTLTSRLDVPPPEHDKKLSGLQPLLKLDLQRLYLIKNLVDFRESTVKVKLALKARESSADLVEGERVILECEASEKGFLNLLNVRPDGQIKRIFPSGRHSDNRLEANVPVKREFIVSDPLGEEYVKAIFTKTPLDLQFLDDSGSAAPRPQDIDDVLSRYYTRTRSLGSETRVGTSEVHFRTVKKR